MDGSHTFAATAITTGVRQTALLETGVYAVATSAGVVEFALASGMATSIATPTGGPVGYLGVAVSEGHLWAVSSDAVVVWNTPGASAGQLVTGPQAMAGTITAVAAHGTHVYVGGTTGVAVSHDNGATWAAAGAYSCGSGALLTLSAGP